MLYKINIKSLLSTLSVFFGTLLFAQSPNVINYQGVARASDGTVISSQSIGLKFDLRQGSATAAVVFSEQQVLTTNTLGLFSTQIGKVNAAGMSGINWELGSYFLEVSIDVNGANSYVSLGTQELASVPYALYAQSVPVTFTNNTLTVGNKSVVITQTIASTPNTTITVSGLGTVTSVGTNTFDINIPSPNFTGQGSTTVSGVYPNYTINTQSSGAPNIAGAGISTVTSSGNNFTVDVQAPSFSGVGSTSVSGAYPNYTISTPAAVSNTLVGSGIAVVSPSIGNNFTVTVNQPTFAYSQATGSLTSGTSSAYITPNLTFTNNVLTSGPASNSVLVSSGWGLTGNAGTTYSNNFIGTNDNNDFSFRLNNQRAGRLEIASQSAYFGYLAGPTTNTATANTGIGYNALNANTSGFGNTGIGYLALQVNTSGFWNTAVGGASQWGTTSGSSNVSLGYQSLRNNSTGSGNIAIGRDAMLFNNGSTNNVVIGSFAMVTSTVGSNNTMIGAQAGGSSVNGAGNVFLGNRAGFNELGSNKLYIANNSTVAPLIYGDFTSGFLGIGTTTAGAPLQFNQTISGRKIVLWEGANNDNQVYGFGLSSNVLRYQVDASVANHVFYSGVNNSSSLELMRIQGNGRVGINNASPTATLDINGTFKLADGSQGLSKVLTSDAAGNASWQTASSGPWTQTGGTVALATSTANVGIGNSTPVARLDVTGSPTFVFPVLKVTNTNSASSSGALDITSNGNAAASIFNSSSTGIGLVVNTTGPALSISNSGASHAIFASNTSTSALNTTAGFFDGGIWLRGKTNTGSAFALFAQDVNSNTLFTVRNDGNIGVKTSNPIGDFHVNSLGSSALSRLTSTAATTGLVTYIDGSSAALLNYQNTPLYFGTNGANRMVISATGNIGIGTSAPTATLHVNGTTRLVDGTQGAGKVLTSDASGNASWVAPAAPSRVRSITIEPGMMDISAAYAVVPASKTVIGGWQRPCVVFPDNALSQVQLNIPIPSDWNAVSSFTIRILYGSPSTSGNFDMQTLFSTINLNQSAVAASSGNNFVLTPNATVEGLSEYSDVVAPSSSSNKILMYTLRRNGATGNDSSTSPMRLFGISIDYRD